MTIDNTGAPGSRFKIEAASWRDLNALRHLEEVCFLQDAWPLWDLIGVLTMPNVVRLKAVVEGEMVGFIAGDVHRSDHLAWIVTVGVLPKFRQQGIGSALIKVCESHLEVATIRLSVRISNHAAVHLYEGLGYRRIGEWPGYYADGEDALVMEKGTAVRGRDVLSMGRANW
jgi:ribosomal protein S18 acetylase RimI-like enzyme